MATTFFPRSSISTAVQPFGTLVDQRELLLTRGAAVTSITENTQAAATGVEIETWSSNFPNNFIWFISNPLNAVTISGTITPNIRALESAAQANYGVGLEVQKLLADGSSASTVVPNTLVGLELGTAEAARTSSITPTSTAFAIGDRLIVAFHWFAAGGTSTTGRTVTGFWNGASGATGDSFVTFTETITETGLTPRPERRVLQAVRRASSY